jgi:hypothetical protein
MVSISCRTGREPNLLQVFPLATRRQHAIPKRFVRFVTRVALTLLACTSSAPAAAQSPPKAAVVDLGVKAGQIVTVLTTDGFLDGTVVSVGAAGLVLRTRTRPITISVESIRLIDAEFNDSVANGALWGLAAGAVLGGLAYMGGRESCGSAAIIEICSGYEVPFIAWGAAIGTAVGILADLSKPSRHIVYRGPSRLSVSVLPVFTPHTTGFQAQLRW